MLVVLSVWFSCEMCGSKLASGVFFFPVTAVTLDTNFAISGVQSLSFGGLLPPFYQPGDHFVSLGTPWGTVGAVGRTRAGSEPDF